MSNYALPSIRNPSQTASLKLAHGEIEHSKLLESIQHHATGMKNDWRPAIGAVFKGDSFQALSMKRGIAKKCSFYDCDFSRVAGTGSEWTKSKFFDCELKETNFDFSSFKDSDFIYAHSPRKEADHEGPGFVGASFSGASFQRSVLKNVYARGTSLARTNFSGASLIDCHFQSCTLEGSNFKDANISGMSFDRINIEYCDFTDTQFDNVNLALMQFPYVFGINEKLIQSGCLKIQTDYTEKFKDNILPWDNLLEIVPDLVGYYLSNHNYFPVCNLYLASRRIEEFSEFLNYGVRYALVNKDYRSLKFLSKLAKTSKVFNAEELAGLYQLINTTYLEGDNNESASHAYSMHEGEIRQQLVGKNTGDLDVLTMEMVLSKKSEKPLLESINSCLAAAVDACKPFSLDMSWIHISASKNSPIKITINVKINSNNKTVTTKEAKSSFINVMSVVFAGMSAIFTGVSSSALWYNNLSDADQKPIVEAHSQVNQYFTIHSLSVNEGTRLYLNSDNGEIRKLNLPTEETKLPNEINISSGNQKI